MVNITHDCGCVIDDAVNHVCRKHARAWADGASGLNPPDATLDHKAHNAATMAAMDHVADDPTAHYSVDDKGRKLRRAITRFVDTHDTLKCSYCRGAS